MLAALAVSEIRAAMNLQRGSHDRSAAMNPQRSDDTGGGFFTLFLAGRSSSTSLHLASPYSPLPLQQRQQHKQLPASSGPRLRKGPSEQHSAQGVAVNLPPHWQGAGAEPGASAAAARHPAGDGTNGAWLASLWSSVLLQGGWSCALVAVALWLTRGSLVMWLCGRLAWATALVYWARREFGLGPDTLDLFSGDRPRPSQVPVLRGGAGTQSPCPLAEGVNASRLPCHVVPREWQWWRQALLRGLLLPAAVFLLLPGLNGALPFFDSWLVTSGSLGRAALNVAMRVLLSWCGLLGVLLWAA